MTPPIRLKYMALVVLAQRVRQANLAAAAAGVLIY